jgi:glycosyltransferase involved in cell wall biosynthesis
MFLSRDYDHWWHKSSSRLQIEAFAEFLEMIRPDVIHFHHFLTYGIDLLTLTRRVLPQARIVFTFHEFLTICAADGHMLRKTDRSLCTNASPIRCHQCIPERRPEEFMLRKLWFLRHLSAVDAFTCPSQFMVQHYVRWGIAPEKLTVVTNGQRDHSQGRRIGAASPGHNRFGFFGQLVDVKGVQVILRAVSMLRQQGFEAFSVEINGGNLRYASAAIRDEIETYLAEEAARPFDSRIVTYNGSYQVENLRGRMSRVGWCIVPSIWWESFGLVISEAWMFGRPVICSNVGGMASRVTDEKDGLHFEVGDPGSLAMTMKRACSEPNLWERLSSALPAPPAAAEMMAGYRQVYFPAEETALVA